MARKQNIVELKHRYHVLSQRANKENGNILKKIARKIRRKENDEC